MSDFGIWSNVKEILFELPSIQLASYYHIKTTTLLNCYWEVVNTRKRLGEAMFSNDHYPIELLLENDGCENK